MYSFITLQEKHHAVNRLTISLTCGMCNYIKSSGEILLFTWVTEELVLVLIDDNVFLYLVLNASVKEVYESRLIFIFFLTFGKLTGNTNYLMRPNKHIGLFPYIRNDCPVVVEMRESWIK